MLPIDDEIAAEKRGTGGQTGQEGKWVDLSEDEFQRVPCRTAGGGGGCIIA